MEGAKSGSERKSPLEDLLRTKEKEALVPSSCPQRTVLYIVEPYRGLYSNLRL